MVVSQLLTESGFVSYAALPYLHYETPTQRTLWVAMADGRCVPELHVLALVRHGSPLPDHYVPVWMDGNPNNRTLDNAWVMVKEKRSAASKAYWRKYYSVPENAAKQRERVKRASDRRRAKLALAKQLVGPTAHIDLLLPDARRHEHQDTLDSIIAKARELQQQDAKLTFAEAVERAKQLLMPNVQTGEGGENGEITEGNSEFGVDLNENLDYDPLQKDEQQ